MGLSQVLQCSGVGKPTRGSEVTEELAAQMRQEVTQGFSKTIGATEDLSQKMQEKLPLDAAAYIDFDDGHRKATDAVEAVIMSHAPAESNPGTARSLASTVSSSMAAGLATVAPRSASSGNVAHIAKLSQGVGSANQTCRGERGLRHCRSCQFWT